MADNTRVPYPDTATHLEQPMVIHTRSNQFYQRKGEWFLTSDDGADVGPFADKAEAQMALLYFVDRTQWPNAKQLREYIRHRS